MFYVMICVCNVIKIMPFFVLFLLENVNEKNCICHVIL